MNSHQPRPQGEWAADLACFYLVCIAGWILINLPLDVPGGESSIGFALWSIAIGVWMYFGAGLLRRACWIRTYGTVDGVSWLFKDALALVIWPFLLKWILNSRKAHS